MISRWRTRSVAASAFCPKSAATELEVGFSTIDFHTRSVCAKLRVRSKSVLSLSVATVAGSVGVVHEIGGVEACRVPVAFTNCQSKPERFSRRIKMKLLQKRKNVLVGLAGAALLLGGLAVAQPERDISPARHPNLAAAQRLCFQAWEKMSAAQSANEWDMHGHAQKAKNLLDEASREMKRAAEEANRH